MSTAPRSIGRPLDPEAAQARARQIAVLTEPVRLRVLSVIAASDGDAQSVQTIVAALALTSVEVDSALSVLHEAGLLSVDGDATYHLTADAWVRFGRLITVGDWAADAAGATAIPSPGTRVDLPPVAARIARDLTYRFSSTFSPETVAKYVAESYSLLAERSQITRFLPSLTAKFATDRLSALATTQGLVLRGTPEVLFVCVQNAGRSQMAAAILRNLAGDKVHVRTAGSSPAAAVHLTVIEALDEIGVSLAAEFPKPLTDEVVQAADYVITMGCGDACPIYPGRRYMDWVLDDPAGKSLDEVRALRDDIFVRVRSLLDDMKPVS